MALFAVSAIAMVIGSYLFVLLLAAASVYLPYVILANSDSFSPQIGPTLRQIHIQRVNVMRAQVARESARTIRCLAAPGPEDSDIAMEIFYGE